MRKILYKTLLATFCAALILAVFVPNTVGDAMNKKVIFTVNRPMEIPGMVLEPGTYVIKLLDSAGGARNVVQIFNKDEDHLYANLLTFSDRRMTATDEPQFVFWETPADTPAALKSWFYPVDFIGWQFIYPEDRALELAQGIGLRRAVVQTAAAPIPEVMEEPAVEIPPVEELPVAAVPTEPEEKPAEIAQVTEAEPERELPKTASDQPLFFLIGLSTLGGAVALRAISKRTALNK